MIYAIYEKASGCYRQICGGASLESIQQDFAPTMGVHPCDITFDVGAHYFDTGTGGPVAFPEKPNAACIFNYVTKQWEDLRTLAELKTFRKEYVNSERLNANQSYFTHLGKQIAVDALSRGDIESINGEINNTGTFPANWPGAWKCIDNSWLPIATVDQWKDMYSAMVNQGTANFTHAQALKVQIDAATTSEQVTNVVW